MNNLDLGTKNLGHPISKTRPCGKGGHVALDLLKIIEILKVNFV